MSATAARQILSVTDSVAEVQEPDGSTISVPVASLKRPELLRAAKVSFPAVGGRHWQKIGNDAIVEAIRTGFVPEIPQAKVTPEPAPEPSTFTVSVPVSERRPNRFPASCATCGTRVPESAGFIRKVSGKWNTYCQTCWTDEPVAATSEPQPSTPPPVVVKSPEPVASGSVESALDSLIRTIVRAEVAQASTPDVDEETVRRIVADYVDAVPARRVEVVTPEATRPLPDLHHELLPKLVQVIGSGVKNVFLVGPAGSGKSTLAVQALAALGRGCNSISFGPTTPTSKLFGYNAANGEYVRTPFRDSYESEDGFLGDELDNGHPGLVAELNQALANGEAAFADGTVKRHPDNVFVATGNTFGRGPDRLFVGRNILDAATLDRFVTIEVPIDQRLERSAALAHATEESAAEVSKWVDEVQAIRTRIEEHNLALICSPRSSIEGAKLITGGLSVSDVREWTLTKGWSQEHRQKLGVR